LLDVIGDLVNELGPPVRREPARCLNEPPETHATCDQMLPDRHHPSCRG